MSNLNLPGYLIIGVQKGGTTSLYHYLAAHPNVNPAKRKEIYFFSKSYKGIEWYKKGVEWYKTQFKAKRIDHKKKMITGEATPNYFDDPLVPERVFKTIPDVKIILLLRNPVDRTYSEYRMGVRAGRYKKNGRTRTFDEMIEDILNGKLKNKFYERTIYERSIYVKHLERWFKVFPREQFLILKSEDLHTYPSITFKKVINFLNLPTWEPKKYKKFNKGYPRYQKMNEIMEIKLRTHFKPYNKKLYDLIGKDFGWEKD